MCDAIPDDLYTKEQRDYVNNISDANLRDTLLHTIRLLDIVTRDRNSFEKQLTRFEFRFSDLKDECAAIAKRAFFEAYACATTLEDDEYDLEAIWNDNAIKKELETLGRVNKCLDELILFRNNCLDIITGVIKYDVYDVLCRVIANNIQLNPMSISVVLTLKEFSHLRMHLPKHFKFAQRGFGETNVYQRFTIEWKASVSDV